MAPAHEPFRPVKIDVAAIEDAQRIEQLARKSSARRPS